MRPALADLPTPSQHYYPSPNRYVNASTSHQSGWEDLISIAELGILLLPFFHVCESFTSLGTLGIECSMTMPEQVHNANKPFEQSLQCGKRKSTKASTFRRTLPKQRAIQISAILPSNINHATITNMISGRAACYFRS